MARQVGIFGGSFNPPHVAHLIIAETIRDEFGLDYILWIPNYIPPHKATAGSDDVNHRLSMVGMTIEGHDQFSLSTIEVDRKGTSYMVDTIQSLQEAEPSTDYHLIIGGDSLDDFMTWHRPEDILNKVPLIVYNRTGVNPEKTEVQVNFPDRISYSSAPLIDISSTNIRKRVAEQKSIRYLVPEGVGTYIHQHNLYI